MDTKRDKEKRQEKNQKEEQGIAEEYQKAADILEDVWLHINWDNVDQNRRRNIWNEFEGQVRALSRCYSSLSRFLDKLCARFDSYLNKYNTREIFKEDEDGMYLNIYRRETEVPMLLLRLRRQNAKEEYKSKTDQEINKLIA